jgi:hypothetical protein
VEIETGKVVLLLLLLHLRSVLRLHLRSVLLLLLLLLLVLQVLDPVLLLLLLLLLLLFLSAVLLLLHFEFVISWWPWGSTKQGPAKQPQCMALTSARQWTFLQGRGAKNKTRAPNNEGAELSLRQ